MSDKNLNSNLRFFFRPRTKVNEKQIIDVKDSENNMKPFSSTSSSSSEPASSDHLQLPKKVNSDQDKIDVVQNDLSQVPYHPKSSEIVEMNCKNKTVHFQLSWFTKFPWLHYDQLLISHTCAVAKRRGFLQLSKCSSEVFITESFRNWTRALEKFANHETSDCHKLAVEALIAAKVCQPVNALIVEQKASDLATARLCLKVIIISLRYLARKGLAMR